MKIAIGTDHGGFNYKHTLISFLKEKGHEVKDFGTYNSDSCSYAEYGELVAKAVQSGDFDRGILICGTGIGMSMVANKVKGIRCAVCTNEFMARATRLHNNANIIALGERVIGEGVMLELVDIFLTTEYEGGRHQARIDKITEVENNI